MAVIFNGHPKPLAGTVEIGIYLRTTSPQRYPLHDGVKTHGGFHGFKLCALPLTYTTIPMQYA